jgi:hypothetical protein
LAYVGLQQETGGPSAWVLKVSVETGGIESGVELGQGGIGDIVVTANGTKAFALVQVDVQGMYSGVFTVVPLTTRTLGLRPPIVVGDVQGLGLLQLGDNHTLYAVDTAWRLAKVDERTDRVDARFKIPVPSLLAATLQPLSFRG